MAALLYEETDPEQVKTLAGIEEAIRGHLLDRVGPELGGFFIETSSGTTRGRKRSIQSISGQLSISEKQGKFLGVKPYSRWSPYLEKCCLLVSANESYQRAAEDIAVLTGVEVSGSTQQRLVHRQTFEPESVDCGIKEMSIDGGKVRLRTPLGQPSEWRDYKGVNLHQCAVSAFFRANDMLVDWVNQQPLASPLVCLGDGHDGIWNLFEQIGVPLQRLEILDWYHLVENLGKVGGSQQRLDAVEVRLWHGDVDGAVRLFDNWSYEQVDRFIAYLAKHRHRIANYSYYQAEGISIGSGEIESSIKQIGRRVKISGAQWASNNVQQVLLHRCAYLNGMFST
ncbi:MAG: ISKra4 family transposase [Leptolyngbya sp. SIO3F4]|nr:ISKra4 family transposase [Leptolyngbya sp. SIO3F4]